MENGERYLSYLFTLLIWSSGFSPSSLVVGRIQILKAGTEGPDPKSHLLSLPHGPVTTWQFACSGPTGGVSPALSLTFRPLTRSGSLRMIYIYIYNT
jgi:hypothetical protein